MHDIKLSNSPLQMWAHSEISVCYLLYCEYLSEILTCNHRNKNLNCKGLKTLKVLSNQRFLIDCHFLKCDILIQTFWKVNWSVNSWKLRASHHLLIFHVPQFFYWLDVNFYLTSKHIYTSICSEYLLQDHGFRPNLWMCTNGLVKFQAKWLVKHWQIAPYNMNALVLFSKEKWAKMSLSRYTKLLETYKERWFYKVLT